MWTKIQIHHVESAIQALYNAKFSDFKFPRVTSMPVLKRLNRLRTKYPLKPVMKDESTTVEDQAFQLVISTKN